jgi:anti-anti-sigma regulatory factor
VAAEHPSIPSVRPTVAIKAADGRQAELTFTGDLGAGFLRELEERLTDPLLSEADQWVVDMSGVTHFELACAYALLRAATRRPETAALTIRGARRTVQRTLHHAELDAVAVMED